MLSSGCGGGQDDKAAMIAAMTAQKKPVAVATAGTVAGKIVFMGIPPALSRINMSTDAVCEAHKTPLFDESIVVNSDGTLKNAAVYVLSGLEGYAYPSPITPPVMNQSGCRYIPHVLAMMPGVIQIKNSDNTLHNVRAESKSNSGFNRGQMAGGMFEETFVQPDIIPFKCDVHPWMNAYVIVANGPSAVTGADGAFSLSPIPAGTYTIRAWHERLGTKESSVNVESGKTVEVQFSF